MGEKITIVDIARMAGVSTATVSRIINGTGRVNDDKREKVLALIDQYDYKPNMIAKSLQSSRSNTVGFIVPHINSPYYAQMFYETEIAAQRNGYTLMLCNSESKRELESNILNAFISAKVCAIVFMGGRLDDTDCGTEALREMEKVCQEVPVISCVDIPELDCMQIYQVQESSSNALLEHLADRGYQDVALMGGYANVRTTVQRRTDLASRAADYGICIRDRIIESDYSVEGGNKAMQQMIGEGDLPQAIVCINDLVATGALSEANKHHMRIPDDVAIVGYDNLDISQFIYPGITTVACNYKEYARAIVEAIQNIDSYDRTARVRVETDLIVRGTTQH